MAGFVNVGASTVSTDIPQTPNQALVYARNSGTVDIAAGDCVVLDAASGTDGSTVKQSDAAASNAVLGVARDPIPAGRSGRVVVWGAVTAKASGAIAAGALVVSATGGAVSSAASPAVGTVVGVAQAAASGGRGRIFVKPA